MKIYLIGGPFNGFFFDHREEWRAGNRLALPLLPRDPHNQNLQVALYEIHDLNTSPRLSPLVQPPEPMKRIMICGVWVKDSGNEGLWPIRTGEWTVQHPASILPPRCAGPIKSPKSYEDWNNA